MKIPLACFVSCFASLVFSATSPSIGDLQVFPLDNPWNWDISGYAVHPNSVNYVASIGAAGHLHPDFGTVYNGAPMGIPYVVVNSSQAKIPINFTDYGDESDAGPFPIPLNAPVEGGPQSTGDRHVIAVDTSAKMLYELYTAYPQAGQWDAGCGAKYDLTSNELRPDTWTSADAAGLPIFPGLVRYEEVYLKHLITHAIRFTIQNSQKAYIWPARHYASSSIDPNRPPMGLRFRLKSAFDISGFSEPVRVILTAMKKYGIIVADNGSNWYISGAPDDRWNDDVLGELKTVAGSNFEAVRTVDTNGDPIYPSGSAIHGQAPVERGEGPLRIIPNPFGSQAGLRLLVPIAARDNVRLVIYDQFGGVVREWGGSKALNNGMVIWDGTNARGRASSSGIYFVNLTVDGKVYQRRAMLIR